MALPARDHRISLVDAAALTKSYRDARLSDVTAGAFHKDQILQLLSQAGCVALRVHLARKVDGTPTVVLTGVDTTDNDLISGAILEEWFPCPPVCASANALNR